MHFIEKAQYRNNSIITYNECVERKKSSNRALNMSKIRATAYSGLVSKGAAKRINEAIDIIIQTSTTSKTVLMQNKRKLKTSIAFITLTIPAVKEVIGDRNITKECLEPFLLQLRRQQSVLTYLWKAEFQSRGVIHYHILINKYVSYVSIRKMWNKILDQNGLMEMYKAVHGHSNANSTDIHAVHAIDNLAGYISKYMCKSEQNETAVKGKIWDCTLNIKRSKRFTIDVCGSWKDRIEQLIKDNKIAVNVQEHCVIFNITREQIAATLSVNQALDYDRWRSGIINYAAIARQKAHDLERKRVAELFLSVVSLNVVKAQGNLFTSLGQSAQSTQTRPVGTIPTLLYCTN